MRPASAVLALVLGLLGTSARRAEAQAGGSAPRLPPPGYPIALVDRPLVLPPRGSAFDLAATGSPVRSGSASERRDIGLVLTAGGAAGLAPRLGLSFAFPFSVAPDAGPRNPAFGLRVHLVPRRIELAFDTVVSAPVAIDGRPSLGLGLPLQAHVRGRALVRFDPRYTVHFVDAPYHQLGARLGLDLRIARRGNLGVSAGVYGGGSSLGSPTYQVPFELRGGGTIAPSALPRLDVFASFGFPRLLFVSSAGSTVLRRDYYAILLLRVFFLDRAGTPRGSPRPEAWAVDGAAPSGEDRSPNGDRARSLRDG